MSGDSAPDRKNWGERLPLPPLLERLQPVFTQHHLPIYLVGGTIRDTLLGRVSHDLDFVVPDQAVKLAFQIANALNAPAYVLDRERDTGRVVLPDRNTTLDFARFRGPDLEADLRDRDFTINAIALPVTAQRFGELIDPCDGVADLAAQRIRQTHDGAISQDPVRALRALRLALNLDFALTPDTATALSVAAPALQAVSPERVRDELQNLLRTARPHQAVAHLDQFGLLDIILPEIADLRGLSQSKPHHEPVLDHTISVLRWLTEIENLISTEAAPGNSVLASLSKMLSPCLPSLRDHLARVFDGGLNGYTLLRLAALFHDTGKKQTCSTAADGQIHFIGHEQVGADIATSRLRQLCLSNQAINQVKRIVAGQQRPWQLANELYTNTPGTTSISRRAVFRYFRETGRSGIEITLLSLADSLAISDGTADSAPWQSLVHTVDTLLHHYFSEYDQTIAPPPLLNGHDLIQHLGLAPGPAVGKLLEFIQEAQAAGEISTRAEALKLAGRHRAG